MLKTIVERNKKLSYTSIMESLLFESNQKLVTINGNVNPTIKDHNSSETHNNVVINLDHGDPKMFYTYWKKLDNECSVTIKASDFANPKQAPDFFYQMPEFSDAVRRVHRVVGNAVTEDRHIIGGTGSSQLFITALRALASSIMEATTDNNGGKRIPVVCAEPYYSYYGEAIEQERSELFEWQGDANTFQQKSGPYIEVVTSPNNPDGTIRTPVVNREGGAVIYDLAYYWPHYTPITSAANYDVMLFTMSKTSGHAGSRVGWAIIKDQEIAKKMKNQILLLTIGSSHEGQLRSTRILNFIADKYEHDPYYMVEKPPKMPKMFEVEGLFEYGHRVLGQRWEKLRSVVQHTSVIRLPDFSPSFCNFIGKLTSPTPAFAWVEFESDKDAEEVMKKLEFQGRSGSRFGINVGRRYIRVNMMGDEPSFNLFLERLSSLTIMD